MSESFFDTYGVTDSGNETETSGDDNTSGVVPNRVSDAYEALGDLQADIGRSLNAHPSDEVGVPGKDDDGERHPSGEMEVWWVAVHDAKGIVGAEQRDENKFSMGDYREAFGRTLGTIEHEDLTSGEKQQMTKAGIDLDEVEQPRRIPVAATGRLPVFVTDEDELNEALKLLDNFVGEVIDGKTATYRTTEGGDDDNTSEAGEPETGAAAIRRVLTEDSELAAAAASSEAGYRQAVVDAVEERHGKAVSKNSVTKEKANLDLSEVAESEDTSEAGDDEQESDDEQQSTSGGLSDEEKQDLATTVATAVVEALDN